MSASMIARVALFAVVVGKAAGAGICYGAENGVDACQAISQAQCTKKFVQPPLSGAAISSYCTDHGFCCADAAVPGRYFRPARGQNCGDLGMITAPSCAASVNWCGAITSASISTPIGGEVQRSEAECRAACIANPDCEGFNFAQNPSRCVLLKSMIPFLSAGGIPGLDPIDDIWTTFVSSFHPSCPATAPFMFNLNDALADFTQNSGLTGFTVSTGAPTTLAVRNTATPNADVVQVAGQIVDNFYYVDATTLQLVKLTGSDAVVAQYKAQVASALNIKLRKNAGVVTKLTWSTPSGPKTTYSVVIGGDSFEPLSGTFLPQALTAAKSKFSTQALPNTLIIGGVTQGAVTETFKNSNNEKIASFLAAIVCTDDQECVGASFATLKMGLCSARSEYSVECNMADPQIKGCQMYVAFLATCGKPTIAYDPETYTYTVTGLGFQAYQKNYKLGEECQCAPVSPK